MTDPLLTETRHILQRLRGVQGVIDDRERAQIMRRLMQTISDEHRLTGYPDSSQLIRLAAHAIRWAEEVRDHEQRPPADPIPGQLELP